MVSKLLVAAVIWLSSLEVIAKPLIASWYGDECRGRPMANGQPFDPSQMTCASWFYPMGTRLRVKHRDRVVEVVVTDRGPAKRLVKQGRVLDLSEAAFRRLAHPDLGLIEVTIERL